MIKLKITFYGINKGREVMEWKLTPENAKGVSDTINYLMASDMRKITNVEMTEIPNDNKAA